MVQVVLPVLDEARALPSVLAGIPGGYEPLVVDNGSTDGSGDIARGLGVEVVVAPQPGFGEACWVGLRASTHEIVCFMDCDGSLRGAELPKVADPVARGEVDLVLGARRPQPGSWPLHARVANRVLVAGLRWRAGVSLTDLGPMRAARREALLGLGLTDRRFGWPLEMVMRASHAGWKVAEVPVAYYPRIGRSKVTGTIKGSARAVRDMTNVARQLS